MFTCHENRYCNEILTVFLASREHFMKWGDDLIIFAKSLLFTYFLHMLRFDFFV